MIKSAVCAQICEDIFSLVNMTVVVVVPRVDLDLDGRYRRPILESHFFGKQVFVKSNFSMT